jgi:ABC-type sugar transport system permease subunit
MLFNKAIASLKHLVFGRTFSGKLARKGYLFILPAVVYFSLVYFYPLFESVKLSFFRVGMGRPAQFIGFTAYQNVFSDSMFWLTVRNTLYYVVLTVPATVFLSLMVALLLHRIQNKGFRDVLSAAYFLPQVMSLVAAALIWGWIYQPIYGLANHVLSLVGVAPQRWLSSRTQVMPSLAVINVWLRLGFDTIIFLAALQSIPEELLEAARIDGANAYRAFRHIMLPLLNPQIVMVTILELITNVKVFDQVYATTVGGPANASRVIMMYLYDTAFQWFKFSEASVVAIFIFVSLLIASLLQWILVRKTAY